MIPVLYQLNGTLTGERYLPGQYRWGVAVQLSNAMVECVPPSAGTLQLTLEVNGVLTDTVIAVGPVSGLDALNPQGRTRRTVNLNLLVPANQQLRWLAEFDGGAQDAPQAIALTLLAVDQSISQVTATPAVLDVRLAGGLVVAAYDSQTGAWSVTPQGTASGVVITTGSTWQLTWSGNTLLTIEDGAVEVADPKEFIVGSGTVGSRTESRLQFCINGSPVMSLSASGLRVTELIEVKEVAIPTGPHFQFWSDVDGSPMLTAVLDGQGMRVTEADEI